LHTRCHIYIYLVLQSNNWSCISCPFSSQIDSHEYESNYWIRIIYIDCFQFHKWKTRELTRTIIEWSIRYIYSFKGFYRVSLFLIFLSRWCLIIHWNSNYNTSLKEQNNIFEAIKKIKEYQIETKVKKFLFFYNRYVVFAFFLRETNNVPSHWQVKKKGVDTKKMRKNELSIEKSTYVGIDILSF
jgi:hypothetical protein